MSSVNSRQCTRTAFVRKATPTLPNRVCRAHVLPFRSLSPSLSPRLLLSLFPAVPRPRARPATAPLFALSLSYTTQSPSRPEFPSILLVAFVTPALFLLFLPLSLYFSMFPNFPFRCDSAAARTPRNPQFFSLSLTLHSLILAK